LIPLHKRVFNSAEMLLFCNQMKPMIINIALLLIVALGLIYLSGVIYAASFADRMIFPHVPSSYVDGPETFKLKTSDGTVITATYLEAPSSQHLILYSHGNGEDIGMLRHYLEVFQAAGISALAYDYPGYGTSSGKASEAGTYAAADAVYTYATQTLNFAPEQITLYGRSLGSGPSCWLAERYPIDRLILDGAFTSTFRVVTGITILPWDKFDNLTRLRTAITCPTLIIHGMDDAIVPIRHAKQNWAALQGEKQKLWVEGAGHQNLLQIAGPIYWDTVLPFIKEVHSIKQ
jgi:pimeloyl-ACP methyl ester carboxylesterase